MTAVVQQASDGGESMSGFTVTVVLQWWNQQRVVVERYGGGIGDTIVTVLLQRIERRLLVVLGSL